MKILVVGPGAIGSVIAGKLALAGHDLTVLGRGRRLREVRQHGICLLDSNGVRTETSVDAIEEIEASQHYDWTILAVSGWQMEALLPTIAGHAGSPKVLSLSNNGGGLAPWIDVLGARLVAGFPGIASQVRDEEVVYSIAPKFLQATTIGECADTPRDRVAHLQALFADAGIPCAIHHDMDAWLRYHAGWMTPLMLACQIAQEDAARIYEDRKLRLAIVGAVRECFGALDALGFQLTPKALHAWKRIPASVLAAGLARASRHPGMAQMIGTAKDRQREVSFLAQHMLDALSASGTESKHFTAIHLRSGLAG